MVESRVAGSGTRVRFTRWQRWRWPLGLLAVAAVPWVPYALVLPNFLPLPAAPHRWLSVGGWCYTIGMVRLPGGYVTATAPCCVLLSTLLWLARAVCARGGVGSHEARRLLREADDVIDPLIRHGAALIAGLVAVNAAEFVLPGWLPGDHDPWMLPMMALFFASVLLPAAAATRWRPRQWVQVGLVAALLCLGGRYQLATVCWLEDHFIIGLTERAEPMCRALDRYTADHGRAPASLDALVPAYLSRVPGTGWSCCPHFSYQPVTAQPGGWRLRVSLPDRGSDHERMEARSGWHHEHYGRWRFFAH
ncbi:MAG: hypothetical protein HZB16_24280 [Armatimonadetes bacterium]|nr:hypothetical protein [Armatimonadota bacterium]